MEIWITTCENGSPFADSKMLVTIVAGFDGRISDCLLRKFPDKSHSDSRSGESIGGTLSVDVWVSLSPWWKATISPWSLL